MARPLKRKRMTTIPEAVNKRDPNTNAATGEKNAKVEPLAQGSHPDRAQIVVDDRTDGRSAKLVLPQCSRCGFPCWLCRTIDASEPGEEDPARWWPKTEVKVTEEVMKTSTANTTTKTTKTDTQKFDEHNRLFISTRDERFATLLERSNIRFKFLSAEMDPEIVEYNTSTCPRSAVILDLDDDQLKKIGTQLRFRKLHARNKGELRGYLNQKLVREDDIPAEEGIQPLSYRRDSWKPRRKGPPVAQNSEIVYDYTGLESDTTFMLGTSMFSAEMYDKLTQSNRRDWLAAPHGVAPYLTFEYKSALCSEPDSVALHQIAAAAAIWLFMRKELRERVSTSPSYRDIRHYGIILTASQFEVWEATTDGQHYDLKQMAYGMTWQAADLRRFVRWSNAIHTWGLGANAESFKKDMEELVGRKEDRPPVPLFPTCLPPLKLQGTIAD